MDRKILFRFGEVVRLPDDSFGTVLGNLFEDDVFADQQKCTVLLFTEFRTSKHDNGLCDVKPTDLRKQYE